MEDQRSHQSHFQSPPHPGWTRCSRRRCTSSSAPPHDGTQGSRRSRLLVHPSPYQFSVPGRINRKIMHFPTPFTCTPSMVPPGACISRGKVSLSRSFCWRSHLLSSLFRTELFVYSFPWDSVFVLIKMHIFFFCFSDFSFATYLISFQSEQYVKTRHLSLYKTHWENQFKMQLLYYTKRIFQDWGGKSVF